MQPGLHSFQPSYHLDVHLQPDENIFEFVQHRFALHHGARIQQLLPWQCTLSDEQGTLLASAGLNPASAGPPVFRALPGEPGGAAAGLHPATAGVAR